MPVIGVVELAFDPYLPLGDLAIRWQTIALSLAILAGLGFAALIDGYLSPERPRSLPRSAAPPAWLEPPDTEISPVARATGRLRLDDMGYLVLGCVPGAVAGGRLVHGLSFWEAYAADPLRLFDPTVGTLSLLGAVLGGTVSAAYVARVIGAPIRRWADAVALPLVFTLALGKLAQLLGGSGQGAAWDGPWSVAFLGAGPWVSPFPELPAHPAQVYEALWLLAGLPLLLRWVGRRRQTESPLGSVLTRLRERQRGGRLFGAAIGWFVLGRVVVGFSWRDDDILGPLNAEQVVALAILLGGGLGLWLWTRRRSIVRASTPEPRT